MASGSPRRLGGRAAGSNHGVVQDLLESVRSIVVPPPVAVPAGETSVDFPVETRLVGAVVNLFTEVPGTVEATLGAVTKQAGVTIQPIP